MARWRSSTAGSRKGPDAFRTISEAAAEVGVAPHVLRFWESRFAFLRPLRRAGGRRLYRPADIQTLIVLRRLLHDEGHSIAAVRDMPSHTWRSPPKPAASNTAARADRARSLANALERAVEVKARLDRLLSEGPP